MEMRDTRTFRLAVGQLAVRKRAIEENLDHMADILRQLGGNADLVVFPETATSGYFVERGVHEVARRPEWIRDELRRRAPGYRGWVSLGFYEAAGDAFFNSAMLADLGHDGTALHVHRKFFLPTYGVFDERRFVSPGMHLEVFPVPMATFGMLVCEDAWHTVTALAMALKGAQVLLIPAASPGRGFSGERISNVEYWRALCQTMAFEHGVWVIVASLCGFEGGRGFVGNSLVVAPDGTVIAEGKAMDEDLLTCQVELAEVGRQRTGAPLLSDLRSTLDLVVRSLEESRT
ncbi:MAG: nitrilase-related carbon-nitrogen hydrolase [Candidatus Dormibacteria bacterium]